MKARIENGQIVLYQTLPGYFRGKNRVFPGGFHLQADEVHEAEGFFDVVIPEEFNQSTHQLGEIFWDETNQVFTYPLNERPAVTYDLEQLRAQRFAEFDSVLDEFAVLISRCQLTVGTANEALNTAIEETRVMQQQTVAAINAIDTVAAMLAFQIRPDDVAFYKAKFDQFKL